MAPEPENPQSRWKPPPGARPDASEAWSAGSLSERETTIAVAVSVVFALAVPYVGFLLGLLLIAERRTAAGIGVLAVALVTIPLFPLWQTFDV